MKHITHQSQLDLSWFNGVKELAYDTETTGVDYHKDKIVLASFAREDGETLTIDARSVDLRALQPVFEDPEVIKIAHNAIFDYNMTRGNYDIKLKNLRDTLVCEKLLTAGLMGNEARVGLDYVAHRYLGIEMSKSIRMSFTTHTGPFFQEQIDYAARDTAHLHQILNKQRERLKAEGMQRVAKLECAVIPYFADIEWHGMCVDRAKVQANIDKWEAEEKEILKQMAPIVSHLVGVDLYGNMAYSVTSQPQTLKMVEMLGIRDAQGKVLESTDKDTLLPYVKHPFIALLLKYRKINKSKGTYGYPWLEKIHPATGRLHPHIDQLGAGTGRPTSKDPNLLNVPRDNAIRNCIHAPEGWKFIDQDYAGCELRIIGDLSKDPKYIAGFTSGIDFHCYVASMLFALEVTKKNENKRLRTPAKGLNFG